MISGIDVTDQVNNLPAQFISTTGDVEASVGEAYALQIIASDEGRASVDLTDGSRNTSILSNNGEHGAHTFQMLLADGVRLDTRGATHVSGFRVSDVVDNEPFSTVLGSSTNNRSPPNPPAGETRLGTMCTAGRRVRLDGEGGELQVSDDRAGSGDFDPFPRAVPFVHDGDKGLEFSRQEPPYFGGFKIRG